MKHTIKLAAGGRAMTLGLIAALTTSTVAFGECGVPNPPAPLDPEGVVAAMPEEVQAFYAGYPNEVYPSGFADMERVEGPWKIGVSFGANLNAFTAGIIRQAEEDFAKLKEEGVVTGEIQRAWSADAASQSPANQIAGFQDLMRAGVNAIVIVPLSGEALAPLVDQAGQQGIVTVAFGGYIPSDYAINMYQNPYMNMAEVLSPILKDLDGKGNALMVRGLPIIPVDPQQYDASLEMLADCPDINVVGTVEGGYVPAQAKTVVMQYLTANSEDIDLVVQTNAMQPGIISAFEQLGKSVPPVTANVAQVGEMAYMKENPDYRTWGTVMGGANQTEAAMRIALRTLAGQGPKATEFAFIPPVVGPDNAADYYVEGSTLNTDGEINGEGQTILPDDVLDAFFERPDMPIKAE